MDFGIFILMDEQVFLNLDYAGYGAMQSTSSASLSSL